MTNIRCVVGLGMVLAWVTALPRPAAAQAQSSGTVAGVVRDTTGAVLPGVTVEASSPALIEKVRSGVTDDQGQYQIVNLTPGLYSITFTLPGFRTLRRDGLALSAGFAANVNVELSVGAVEESVTVSGQAPLVDTRSTARNEAFTRAEIDALPTAKHFSNLAVLIPGMTVAGAVSSPNRQDVGGTLGDRNPTLSFHGSRNTEQVSQLDGVQVTNAMGLGAGANTIWVANNGVMDEVVIDTSGLSAEALSSGVRINQIPKSGGNTVSGSFYTTYTTDALQTSNLDDELTARGATPYNTAKIFDFNPAVGGPIRKDKLWFYYGYRDWGSNDQPPGAYYDTNPTDWVYTPDLNRPAEAFVWFHTNNGRLTWQPASKQKLTFYADNIRGCTCHNNVASNQAPEASGNRLTPVNYLLQGNWTWTLSNKLLLEVGQSYKRDEWDYERTAEEARKLGTALDAPDHISVVDNGRGITFRSQRPGVLVLNYFDSGKILRGQSSMSYVTGGHQFRVGLQWHWSDSVRINANDTQYTFNNGVPTQVTYAIGDNPSSSVARTLGIYAQEQYKLKRLTLNAGLRFDHLNTYIRAAHLAPGKYWNSVDFPRYDNLPNWKNISPRMGAALDVFGTGKTALKWNAGRYIEAMLITFADQVNPLVAQATQVTTRNWTDNGDFIPQESELAASSNVNFATSNVGIRYDPDVANGWGKRQWNWETSASIQQELRPGLSVDAGYYRRWRGNFRVTNNLSVTPADYSPFCVTAPVDARLPNGGAYPVCGLYDINPTKFGQVDNVVTFADNFGKQTEVFNSVDIAVSARLSEGLTLQGGTSTGRVETNACFAIDSPQVLLNCNVKPPFLTQVKALGLYRLPWWGLRASATFQSATGPEITAAWTAPAASVTGLGRALSGGARTVSAVPLIAPGTVYGDRLYQLDFRLGREFRVGPRLRIEAQFDIYNLLNGNAVTSQNNTYGSSWQTPIGILPGRLAKFGVLARF